MNLERRHHELIFTVVTFLTCLPGVHQLIQGCPNNWELNQQSCYKFVFYPTLKYQDAKMSCLTKGAGVVSINSLSEHNYITQWIKGFDKTWNSWYTSGIQISKNHPVFRWEGDGSPVPDDPHYWLSEADRNQQGEIIVYTWKDAAVGWSRSHMTLSLPYICEIPQVEAYRIVQDHRDFDYGTETTDPNNYLRGPTFSVEATDVVVISQKETKASVECAAIANPAARYGWSRIEGGHVIDITGDLDPRYTLTNGRLTIDHPEEGADSGRYQCRAENQFGMIIGSIIQLSFGYIGEFSNVPRETVRTYEYNGAAIECIPPNHKPALTYQWYKDNAGNFVRPSLQPYLFISALGKLYFSEVTRVDEGRYYCVATLSSNYGDTEIKQTPSRTSLPIPLQIMDGTAREWGPDIHSDFIAVFPATPLRGQMLRMECFAYGTTPLIYSWSRVDGPITDRAVFIDSNRIVIIPNVQLEDSGQYKCSCRRTSTAIAEKTVNVVISAKPFFNFPLRHKHVDIGSQLTWRCGAKGVPYPTYSWFKNGQVIQPVAGEIEVSHNVLIIKNLNPDRHDGMYQCSATNLYGTSVSSAQLRVLSLAPTFEKFPLRTSQEAALGGNVTYLCEPEAAPFPEFTWSKNGANLGLVAGDTSGRIRLLRNGNLLMTQVQSSDAGKYRCTATNQAGSGYSEGALAVTTGITISRPPSSKSVLLNETTFMFCQASYNPVYDMVYLWTLNGRDIDVTNNPYFGWGTGENSGGLYIRGAQFKHAGEYVCTAKTPLDEARASAYLTVVGPPGPPAGVQVDVRSITSYTMKVRWTVGEDNHRSITSYVIQARTAFNRAWRYITGNIPDAETVEQGEDMRRYVVIGLRPGNMYNFRMAAVNNLGQGDWSWPSDAYHTPGAPPSVAPEKVEGAGGRVGLLTARWEPLDESEHNGDGIGYNVFWRKKGVNLQTWSKSTVYGNSTFFATTVGVANYYLEYEIKVQPFNIHGPGPNSTIAVIYSAEGMPTGMPTGVFCDPYNSTSIMVHWTPVPNDRDFMKGRVLGYQVNYYIADIDNPLKYSSTYPANSTSGIIVGLYPGTFYWSGVQVYNTAGLGPESETDLEQTYADAPRLYPTEVAVHSINGEHIRVTFRGVSTGLGEEPLLGYKLRYWLFNDDIRGARDIGVGKDMDGVINGLEKGYIYELRVLGYSNGGDGKMSPSVFFTVEGGQVRLDPETAEIIAGSSMASVNFSILVMAIILLTLEF
ncbi:contactin-like isoform X2 [Liolophura sinensis]|uniref:contactin-like isoform X2 n=1 Tax=Liolophura sinensis TaxID=3198878 RepID=UPI003158605F